MEAAGFGERSPHSLNGAAGEGGVTVEYLRVDTQLAKATGPACNDYNTPEVRSEGNCSSVRNYPKF